MFTRYAYADAEVLDVKGSPVRQVTASLDKVADYENYRTDQGYMYVRIRAISSRVNKNHDGWPSIELAGSPEIFKRHQAAEGFVVEAADGNPKHGFATFVGKPIFVDHNNSNPRRARGVIVDSKFRVLDQRTAAGDDYWTNPDVDPEHLPASEAELLLEVDAKQYPKFAKAILNGELDGFSMGANVEYTKCSHCGNVAHDPAEFCSHVMMKGAHHDIKTADGKRVSKKSYENCYKCAFFEISGVFEPADETALAREVRSGIIHEGELYAGPGTELADPARPGQDSQVADLAMQYEMQGVDASTAMDMAQRKIEREHGKPPGHGEGATAEGLPKQWDYSPSDMNGMPGPGGLEGFPPPHRPDSPATQFGDAAQEAINQQWPKRPVPNDWRSSSQHTAENPLPQEMMTRAPDEVDTLRDEQICPICGSDMDSETCKVCGFVQPPKEFDNPDLQEAQRVREEMKAQDEQQAETPPNPVAPGSNAGGEAAAPPGKPQGPLTSKQPTKGPATASVTNDMRWTPQVHPKTAARINQGEVPVRTTNQPTTNEPSTEVVLSDQTKPVTAAMQTARRLMAAATNPGEEMATSRTASPPDSEEPRDKGHHPGDDVRNPEVKTDVVGVGGVLEPSNEESSKADAQVDVTGVGGTGVEGVEADSSTDLPVAGRESDDSGFNKDKITESIPTKTYPDSDGGHSGVTSPVTSEVPYWIEESKWSATLRKGFEDGTLEQQEQQGDPVAQGGSAVQGVQPIDSVATDSYKRVNVLEHATTPDAMSSGPTTTWSGTDGNGVLKQQDAVTDGKQNWGLVPVPDVKLHTTGSAIKARMINAGRLVDAELELGLLNRQDKWSRIAQLSDVDPALVGERLKTLDQVKTAGQAKLAQHKLATKLPRSFGKQTAANHDFERIASETTASESVSDEILDSALFTR